MIKSHLNVSLSLICFLYLHPRSLCPSSLSPPPPRSPCVQVPHLSFGCCADGSLLVLHNGSKVSVPHAISTLKLLHSSCLLPIFVVFLKMILYQASGLLMCAWWYCGLELRGSYKNHRCRVEAAWTSQAVNTLTDIILFSLSEPHLLYNLRSSSHLSWLFSVSVADNLWSIRYLRNKPDVRISDQPEKWKCKSTICSVIPKQPLFIIQELI